MYVKYDDSIKCFKHYVHPLVLRGKQTVTGSKQDRSQNRLQIDYKIVEIDYEIVN